MSAYGTKRTSRSCCRMSAFGGKADITISERHVCFGRGAPQKVGRLNATVLFLPAKCRNRAGL
jgi:hypothetical protein